MFGYFESMQITERAIETSGLAAGVRFQPVDAGEVAYPMADLVAGYLRAVGKRRPLVPVWLPGTIARVVREGANLPDQGATLGHRTWEEFLSELAVIDHRSR
jgi:hypothetical protein